ncbi:MAG: hemolysin family protein [Ignavibacteriaceae bacterium]
MDLITFEIIFLLILIIIASFLSAAEVAIASFGANKIEELKERKDKSAADFELIQKNSDSFFGTIQFITTFCLFLSSLIGFHLIFNLIKSLIISINIHFVSDHIFFISGLIIAALFSLLTLIFVTLIPKAIGFKYSEGLAKISVKGLIFLTGLFKYPVILISRISNSILSLFNEKTSFSQTRLSEDEIRIIISEGVKTGAIDETEKEIIENVFEFNDLRAFEVMVPRTDMVAIELTEDIAKIKEEILTTRHSLIPVFENSIDNILGVLHTKDIIKYFIENRTVDLKALIRPIYFVPEKKLISQILKEMQNRGERLAIVTDEYGGTEGIISMEDIIEEIVGEFSNTNIQPSEYIKTPDEKYNILGAMSIDNFNEIFNIELPESEEYNTVAGFISFKTGKILNTGETFQFENLTFELIKKIRQKMVQFKVYSLQNNFYEKEK